VRKPDRIAIGATFLLAAACTSAREPVESGPILPEVSLAAAIRIAGQREPGWIPVAAGTRSEQAGTYDVALLSKGLVRETSVDAATGQLTEVQERPVRAGYEDLAGRLEAELPGAPIDLAGAAEMAASSFPERRTVGIEVEPSGERLVYRVSFLSGGERSAVRIDVATGALEALEAESR